jgi:hypothetical protein
MIFFQTVGGWRETAPTKALAKLAVGGTLVYVFFSLSTLQQLLRAEKVFTSGSCGPR